MSNKDKMILEGFLYNSGSNYLIILNGEGESIEIDDTLMRSEFLGKKVKLTVELAEVGNAR